MGLRSRCPIALEAREPRDRLRGNGPDGGAPKRYPVAVRGPRLVPLATTLSEFEAKVLVARLGADGIICAARGANCSLYPLGDVDVLVAEEDLERACELLLADEVEDALSGNVVPAAEGAVLADLVFAAVLALVAAGFLLFRLSLL